MITINSVDHLHIYSADCETAVAFYVDHFGARAFATMGRDDGRTLHFLKIAEQTLVIGPPPEPVTGPPPTSADWCRYGLAHFGVNVTDIEQAVATLQNEGVEMLTPIVRGKGLRYAFVSAPDGVVIELTAYG